MEQSFGIKRAHNGTVGESRTKSFLIDRFWILERSADIDGADFIIQRKLKGQSILDHKPPRFGIVQSKFSQNKKTRHILKKEYVLDKKGKPFMEFFLLINVGFEDSQEMYLLSANDIFENFKINNKNQYLIDTNKLIQKFKIHSKKSSLDFIESSIQCAEFYKNRIYVFRSLSSDKPDFNAIHPEYKYNIEYNDGIIPDLFSEQKTKAYKFMLEIEEIHKQLLNFIEEVSPLESSYIAELFNRNYNGVIKIPQIFDNDFYHKTKRYLEQINHLKDEGILENYLKLRDIISNNINRYLSSNIKNVGLKSQHLISLKYKGSDLSEVQIINRIVTSKYSLIDYSKYLYLKEGHIKIVIDIGLDIKNNNLPLKVNNVIVNDIIEKIYELKYHENKTNF